METDLFALLRLFLELDDKLPKFDDVVLVIDVPGDEETLVMVGLLWMLWLTADVVVEFENDELALFPEPFLGDDDADADADDWMRASNNIYIYYLFEVWVKLWALGNLQTMPHGPRRLRHRPDDG